LARFFDSEEMRFFYCERDDIFWIFNDFILGIFWILEIL
jgi:hypothetical protein